MKPYTLLVVAACALLVAGCSKPKAVVPATFDTFTASDKDFKCDQPHGWASAPFDSSGTESGTDFTSGDAQIHIDANSSGSYMGDIVNNGGMGNGTMGSATQLTVPPVEKLHAMQQQDYQNRLHDYSEIATNNTTSSYGDGRVTEYKASDVHGYRVTILGHDREVKVDATCTDAEWPALQPAFLRVINSITPAGGS